MKSDKGKKITSDKCMICSSKTHYFFSKNYAAYQGSPFRNELQVDYCKCENCGFVFSQTHTSMTTQEWAQLNSSWHHYYEQNIDSRITNQPPYAEQALALIILAKNDLINLEASLDYAAGYGSLAKTIKKYFHKDVKVFDNYIQDSRSILNYVSQEKLEKYKLLINSAMFEHVLKREHLNSVNDLVDQDGVLMIHTVICENIPKDPNWFYLTPIVHTAFHTNKSMSILMKQWGYEASLYSPLAKSWFLFKKDYPNIRQLEAISHNINKELQTKYLYYKEGFVDYWKGF